MSMRELLGVLDYQVCELVCACEKFCFYVCEICECCLSEL